jgi:hypothetical protein
MDACYKTLGLTPGAPAAAVKARYRELALTCHPDKLTHATPEERHAKEEYFKEVTVAYHRIIKNDIGVSENDLDWKAMWEAFVNNKELWSLFQQVVKTAVKKATEKVIEKEHFIRVPVTLEEVHLGKSRKLRLFLKNIRDPVFTEIQCSDYPSVLLEHTYRGQELTIYITMVLQEHPVYTSDDLLNAFDLYADTSIDFIDYLTGCTKVLQYMDGTDIVVDIEPFVSLDVPIVLKRKGLLGKGDLYIHLNLTLPCRPTWSGMSDEAHDAVLQKIKILYAPNAHTEYGKLKPAATPKTI